MAEHKNILFGQNVATFFPFSHTTRLSELVLNVLILNIGKVRIIIFWLCSVRTQACGNIDPAHVYIKKVEGFTKYGAVKC